MLYDPANNMRPAVSSITHFNKRGKGWPLCCAAFVCGQLACVLCLPSLIAAQFWLPASSHTSNVATSLFASGMWAGADEHSVLDSDLLQKVHVHHLMSMKACNTCWLQCGP
jgi:hypothetical protein